MSEKTLDVVYFDNDLKGDPSARLKRIEGQVRGLDNLLHANEPCPRALNQISATLAPCGASVRRSSATTWGTVSPAPAAAETLNARMLSLTS